MITTFYPPYNFGGAGIYVHRLSNELARRGHQVTVIHSIDACRLQAHRDPVQNCSDHPNVTVDGLARATAFLTSLVTQQTGVPFVYTSRIQKILGQGFDVINYHNVSLVGGAQALTYGNAIKLYTIHEYWLVCPTHVLFRDNRAVCAEKRCLPCSLVYRRPPRWWRYTNLLPRAVQHVDAFIAPSRFCRDAHHQRGFTAPIVYLPSFIPAAPLALRNEKATPYFLFVGRLEQLKGVQTLIPLFQNYPRARLLIAGVGAYEKHLRGLAQESDNIQFLGRMAGAELNALYRNAIALIVPSLCFEAFPTVIAEAFQQQTPVIARNLGAMPEIISESGGGLVYDNDAALIAGMDRLAGDRSDRHVLGIRGYDACQRNWTTDTHLRNYLPLIDRVAEEKNKQ